MRRICSLVLAVLLASLIGCGDSSDDASGAQRQPSVAPATATPAPAAEISDVEMEQGIGPIRDLTLGEIDPALAAEGEQHFTLLCTACHRFPDRYIGPALGDVLGRRRPEFVMNMMLNANEMMQRHPVVKELLAEYIAPMAQQSLTQEQARAILEYIRTQQK